jgi:hypothetical protein
LLFKCIFSRDSFFLFKNQRLFCSGCPPGYPILSVQSRLSSPVCPVLSVLSLRSCPFGPVPAVLTQLSCSGFAVPADQSRLTFPTELPPLSCPAVLPLLLSLICPVLVVLSVLPCCGRLIFSILSRLFCLNYPPSCAFLPRLSCPTCRVLTIMFRVSLPYLLCLGCPVLDVPSQMS